MPNKNVYHPSVTVLLTVRNEDRIIKKRLENLIEVDYPENSLEILVVSDGSTDKTNSIVEDISKKDNRVRLLNIEGGGKSYAQNKAIPYAKGDIVILTDAETLFDKDTFKKINLSFADDNVGCASGKLILINKAGSIAESQGLYWKYETLLRKLESRLGILHTASGQLMAFRKKLFRPFENKYGDDCIIPLDIVSQGYKIVHNEDAIAYDTFPCTIKGELKTRVRMTLRNITCTLSKYHLLNPFKYPFISFSILSHKIFRWLIPYFMIALFITNLFLLNEGNFYKITFYLQSIFYILGLTGFVAEKYNYRIPIASQAFSFLLANIGLFIGVLKAILGQSITSYKTTK